MTPQSAFDILNVRPGAEPREVRRKYMKLCLECHPDKGGDSCKFVDVTEAYRCLSAANAFGPLVSSMLAMSPLPRAFFPRARLLHERTIALILRRVAASAYAVQTQLGVVVVDLSDIVQLTKVCCRYTGRPMGRIADVDGEALVVRATTGELRLQPIDVIFAPGTIVPDNGAPCTVTGYCHQAQEYALDTGKCVCASDVRPACLHPRGSTRRDPATPRCGCVQTQTLPCAVSNKNLPEQ